jgi:hypothetical protein
MSDTVGTICLPQDTLIDGPLVLTTRDYPLGSPIAADAPMDVDELTAGLELKENLYALSNYPWKVHGKFEDELFVEKSRRKNSAKERVSKMEELTRNHVQKRETKVSTGGAETTSNAVFETGKQNNV